MAIVRRRWRGHSISNLPARCIEIALTELVFMGENYVVRRSVHGTRPGCHWLSDQWCEHHRGADVAGQSTGVAGRGGTVGVRGVGGEDDGQGNVLPGVGVEGHGLGHGPGGSFISDAWGANIHLEPHSLKSPAIGQPSKFPRQLQKVQGLPTLGAVGDLWVAKFSVRDPHTGEATTDCALWVCAVAKRGASPAMWRQVLLGDPVVAGTSSPPNL